MESIGTSPCSVDKIAISMAMFNMFNMNAVDQRVTVFFCSSIETHEVDWSCPSSPTLRKNEIPWRLTHCRLCGRSLGGNGWPQNFRGIHGDTGIHQMATWPEGNFTIDRTILGWIKGNSTSNAFVFQWIWLGEPLHRMMNDDHWMILTQEPQYSI